MSGGRGSESENLLASPVLLIGANGMLGRAWQALLEQRQIAFVPLTRPNFDVTDEGSIEAAVRPGHRLVINCSAWTDVDGAESPENYDAAYALNATGVGLMAERCAAIGATLVHYSTDYVFDGEGEVPYHTDAPRKPVNAYGRTKAEGERLVEASRCRHLLVRTSWLYAPWGKNFVLTMARLTKEKASLQVVNDQRGRPTSAEHLAATSLAILERGAEGTFHVTDGGDCTWYDFAAHINERLGHGCDVQPCETSAFPRPAKRPTYSVLDLSKTEELVGAMPGWRENVDSVLDRMVGSADPPIPFKSR